MHIRRYALASLALMGFACLPASALAAPVFSFLTQVPNYNGGSGFLQASGTLTCAEELDANHSCFVAGITGTGMNPYFFDSTPVAITGLTPYNGADQRIFYFTDEFHPSHGDLTFAGLSFTTGCNAALPNCADPFGISINLFSRGLDSQGRLRIREQDNFFDGEPGKIGSAAGFQLNPIDAVPEPSTWAMLIVGFGFVGMTLRRRSIHVTPAI